MPIAGHPPFKGGGGGGHLQIKTLFNGEKTLS